MAWQNDHAKCHICAKILLGVELHRLNAFTLYKKACDTRAVRRKTAPIALHLSKKGALLTCLEIRQRFCHLHLGDLTQRSGSLSRLYVILMIAHNSCTQAHGSREHVTKTSIHAVLQELTNKHYTRARRPINNAPRQNELQCVSELQARNSVVQALLCNRPLEAGLSDFAGQVVRPAKHAASPLTRRRRSAKPSPERPWSGFWWPRGCGTPP